MLLLKFATQLSRLLTRKVSGPGITLNFSLTPEMTNAPVPLNLVTTSFGLCL